MSISQTQAEARARGYTAAWCSQNPDAVAAFFAPDGRIAINGGEPSQGRDEIAEMARGFMRAFPDLVVRMDDIRSTGTHAVYRWTLEGHNTGPEGTGRHVQVGGFEYWRYDDAGLVAESFGHFDVDDYERQLNGE